MTNEFFCEEIMKFINGTTGIQPPTNCSILSSSPSATFSSTVFAVITAPQIIN